MRRLILLLLLVSLGSTTASGVVPCDVLSGSPACYVAVRPGPTRNVFDLVETTEAAATDSEGQLLLTTVLIQQELTWQMLRQIDRDPTSIRADKSRYFPDDVDPASTREQFAAMMRESEQSAIVAALRELGIELTGDGVTIQGVLDDAPSAGVLVDGDVLVGLDGEPLTDADQLGELIGGRAPGDQLVFDVELDDGSAEPRTVTLGAHPDDPTRGFMGVFLVTRVAVPVDVTIDAGSIGGPSAGMMFALTIVDILTPDDLTGGLIIAGTGEIGLNGRVGPIGGIEQKVAAATRRGEEPNAVAFLVPRGNFADALKASVAEPITLVPIDTLGDSIAALAALRAGETPADSVVLSPPTVDG